MVLERQLNRNDCNVNDNIVNKDDDNILKLKLEDATHQLKVMKCNAEKLQEENKMLSTAKDVIKSENIKLKRRMDNQVSNKNNDGASTLEVKKSVEEIADLKRKAKKCEVATKLLENKVEEQKRTIKKLEAKNQQNKTIMNSNLHTFEGKDQQIQ